MLGRLWTRLLVLVASASLLVGCYSLRKGTEPVSREELQGLRNVYLAWIGLGRPPMKASCDLGRFRKYVVDDAELSNMCGRRCPPGNCPDGPTADCPRGCAAGCFFSDSKGFALGYTSYPTAVVHESQAETWPLVRHEALHYIAWCAGLGLDWNHGNADIWSLDK